MNEGRGGFKNKFSLAGAFIHELVAHVAGSLIGEGSGRKEHDNYGETSTTDGAFDAMYQSGTPASIVNGELYEMNN